VHLEESSRTAVALAVADTLNAAASEVIARRNFEPREVAKLLLQDHPASSYHFSEAEERLYERTILAGARIGEFPKVRDLGVLERLPNLHTLVLESLPEVKDLEALTHLKSLTKLVL